VSRKVVLGLAAALSAAAFVFLSAVLIGEGLVRAGLWAAPLGALAGIVAAAAAVWVSVPRSSKMPLSPELEVPEWVVGRPKELAAVVQALIGGRTKTVGITTGLYGAGGFGKTTLAQMVCAEQRIRQRFGGRVYLVTVGRDVRGAAAISAKVNDVIKLVTGLDATFTDPQLAGQQLGSILDAGPRSLLVLDDVWWPEQLAPFVQGGKRCVRLMTTRVPELLAGRGVAVRVDQMSSEQARALLTSGLPSLDPAVVQGLLAVTGRWPLLLRLVNKILVGYARVATDVSTQGVLLLERLRAGGPAVVDGFLGDAGQGVDVSQPHERARAVRATIEASTSLLNPNDAERFVELGVFAEDETIPFSLMARLWLATADLDDLEAAQVCERLTQLALISRVADPAYGITLHDVIRDFLRAELGPERLAALNRILLDTFAADLLTMSPRDVAALGTIPVAWWELGDDERYMWDHLIEHMMDAGCTGAADAVAGDLRWVGARLMRFGPAAPASDLSTAGTPRAARQRAVLERAAHLLAPTEPMGAVVDVLHSRVASDPEWGPQATALRDACNRPRLVNRWPLPDLPDPALRRVLADHTAPVAAVVVAPDGSWLASGSHDGTVRIWDIATGQIRATLTCYARRGRRSRVLAVAVAPDGSWLASDSRDGTVRIWDLATGQVQATFTDSDYEMPVAARAVGRSGSWLASGGATGREWIGNVAAGQQRVTFSGHTGRVTEMGPNGSWLASGGDDGMVRIQDVATGQEWATFTGHSGRVAAVAAGPDGSWLASGGEDGTIRIWDVATGQGRAVLTGHSGGVAAVAAGPDGSWLASGGEDGTIRIWRAAIWQAQAIMRLESRIDATAWLTAETLAVSGSAGLYLFDFLVRR
jgi:NB-ARC domain/WD domain, G-beta repeat